MFIQDYFAPLPPQAVFLQLNKTGSPNPFELLKLNHVFYVNERLIIGNPNQNSSNEKGIGG